MMRLRIAALLGAIFCWTASGGASAQSRAALESFDHTVCRLIENSARANRLPVEFVTRLIWRESSFRPTAVSPVGAQGIAQFMPYTARERGVADPFDPEQAIPKAAHFLAELRSRFGNLGTAAAAYNAGPARVASWLRGDADLPAETRAYVRFVTERRVEDWAPSQGGAAETSGTGVGGCLAALAELRRDGGGEAPEVAPLAPWGVQLAGNFSKSVALASFERARQRYAAVIGDLRPMVIGRMLRSRGTRRFYQVRLPAPSREAANALCLRIRSAGGVCVAMHS